MTKSPVKQAVAFYTDERQKLSNMMFLSLNHTSSVTKVENLTDLNW